MREKINTDYATLEKLAEIDSELTIKMEELEEHIGKQYYTKFNVDEMMGHLKLEVDGDYFKK